MKKETFLITGGAGFIGSSYIKYLNSQGIENIYIVEDFDRIVSENLYDLKYQELIPYQSCLERLHPSDFDAVLHFGAYSSTTCTGEEVYENNVMFTKKLASYCSHKEKFIFASSSAVYGNHGYPNNFYSLTKRDAEKYVTGSIICRFFNVYGAGEKNKPKHSRSPFANYLTGDLTEIRYSDDLERDFIYIDDLIQSVEILRRNKTTGTHDIGTGSPIKWDQIPNILKDKDVLLKKINIFDPTYQKKTRARPTIDVLQGRNIIDYHRDNFKKMREEYAKLQ